MKLPTTEIGWCRILWGVAGVVFALTYLVAPIADPDFFWHLRTGQWIWEHMALPTADPFAYSTGQAQDIRQYYILTSYWLAQLFYFLVYSLSGWVGFFVVRVLFLGGLVWLLWRRKHDSPLVHALFITTFLVVLCTNYMFERPQFFSFIFFAAALVLLERLADEKYSTPPAVVTWGLPAVMLAWGNMHGGVMLGQILCFAHLFHHAYRLYSAQIDKRHFFRIAAIIGVSLLMTLVGPNLANYPEMYELLGTDKYAYFNTFILEYAPLHLVLKKDWDFWFFPIMSVLAVYGMVRGGLGKNVLYLVLFCCFAYYGSKHVRYLPFLGILFLPYASNAAASFSRKLSVPLLAGLCVALIASPVSAQNFSNLKRLARSGAVSGYYPQAAAEFVKQNGLQGNLLNNYDWGGFLIWSFGEERKVFIDGRTLDVEIFKDWRLLSSILSQSEENIDPYLQKLGKERILSHVLGKYRFDYAVLPRRLRGKPYWLTEAIINTGHWKIAFDQDNSVVLLNKQSGY